jgi:hypothetical protein
VDALGRLLGFVLLPERADGPAKRHRAVVGRDRDCGIVELGVPEELVVDFVDQLSIGHSFVSFRSSPIGRARSPAVRVRSAALGGIRDCAGLLRKGRAC